MTRHADKITTTEINRGTLSCLLCSPPKCFERCGWCLSFWEFTENLSLAPPMTRLPCCLLASFANSVLGKVRLIKNNTARVKQSQLRIWESNMSASDEWNTNTGERCEAVTLNSAVCSTVWGNNKPGWNSHDNKTPRCQEPDHTYE